MINVEERLPRPLVRVHGRVPQKVVKNPLHKSLWLYFRHLWMDFQSLNWFEVLVKRAFIWCTLTKSCLRIDDARWSNVAGKPTCLIRFVLRLWARLRDVDADKQVFYGTRPWTRTSGPGKLSFGFYIVKIHIYVDVKGQLCISSNLGATAIAVWLRLPQKNTQRQKISSDLMAIPHGSRSIKLHSYYGRVIICLLSLSSCFKMLPKKCFIN